MLTELELKAFKCFKHLRLPLRPLTVLSGVNASGKSSVLQALMLLHQTVGVDRPFPALQLNGAAIKLGTVTDVVNQIHGRNSIEVSLTVSNKAGVQFGWRFEGSRNDMVMEAVKFWKSNKVLWQREKGSLTLPPGLSKLLLPEEHLAAAGMDSALEGMEHFSRFLAYVAAERAGPRDTYPLTKVDWPLPLGPDGSDVASILYAAGDLPVREGLCIADTPPNFGRQVEAWLGQFFPGFAVQVNRIEHSNSVTMAIRTARGSDWQRPSNTGFGITQVLPVVVAALTRGHDGPLLIENPEIHLHPAGQAMMGRFLAQVAQAGVQVILETHSDHVLNGVRRFVKNSEFSGADVGLLFFHPIKEGVAQVESLNMDDKGKIDHWPDGFFDQFEIDTAHFSGWD